MKKLPSTPWHLSDDEKSKISTALKEIPVEQRFSFSVHGIPSSLASITRMNDFVNLFNNEGWGSVSGTQDFSLNPELKGIAVGIANMPNSNSDIPNSARLLLRILSSSGMGVQIGKFPGVPKNDCVLLVGSRPD